MLLWVSSRHGLYWFKIDTDDAGTGLKYYGFGRTRPMRGWNLKPGVRDNTITMFVSWKGVRYQAPEPLQAMIAILSRDQNSKGEIVPSFKSIESEIGGLNQVILRMHSHLVGH